MLTVSKARLVKDITNTKILDQKPTRDGYGQGLIIVGEKDERVVVLCADLTESTRSLGFKQKFPKLPVKSIVSRANKMWKERGGKGEK
jgi:transketolase